MVVCMSVMVNIMLFLRCVVNPLPLLWNRSVLTTAYWGYFWCFGGLGEHCFLDYDYVDLSMVHQVFCFCYCVCWVCV